MSIPAPDQLIANTERAHMRDERSRSVTRGPGSPCPRWSAASYSRNMRLYVVPQIGSAPPATVDAGTLNTRYAALLADGRRKDHAGGGLSPRTVRYIHTIIHRALKDTLRWGKLARNPADATDPPKASASGSPESTTWAADRCAASSTARPRVGIGRVPRAGDSGTAPRRGAGAAMVRC
jgi:hypothetical protein